MIWKFWVGLSKKYIDITTIGSYDLKHECNRKLVWSLRLPYYNNKERMLESIKKHGLKHENIRKMLPTFKLAIRLRDYNKKNKVRNLKKKDRKRE